MANSCIHHLTEIYHDRKALVRNRLAIHAGGQRVTHRRDDNSATGTVTPHIWETRLVEGPDLIVVSVGRAGSSGKERGRFVCLLRSSSSVSVFIFRHDLAAHNVLHDSLPMLIGRECASPAIIGQTDIARRRDRTRSTALGADLSRTSQDCTGEVEKIIRDCGDAGPVAEFAGSVGRHLHRQQCTSSGSCRSRDPQSTKVLLRQETLVTKTGIRIDASS